MLGLFVSAEGFLSIITGEDFDLAPELAADPHTGKGCFRLRATDPVIDPEDGELKVLAVYERVPSDVWHLAIRQTETAGTETETPAEQTSSETDRGTASEDT